MRRHTYFTILLCLFSIIVLPACDSAEEEALDELSGTWVRSEANFDLFIRITRTQITVAVENEDFNACSTDEIISYDADTGIMTIRDAEDPEDEDRVEIRRRGDDLVIEGDVYERSDSFPASCM